MLLVHNIVMMVFFAQHNFCLHMVYHVFALYNVCVL